MNIIKFSVKRSVTVAMVFIAIVLFSTVSLSRLKMDLFPSITAPMALVMAEYSGAGSQEIESVLTKPLEAQLGSIQGLTEIQSVSSFGSSMIMLTMTQSTDMDYATLQIRERVDMIKDYLPDGVGNILVMKLDTNMMPVVMIGLTGARDLAELKTAAEDSIVPRLERADGVASVSLMGGYTRQINVTLNPVALEAYGLSLGEVANYIRGDNLNYSVGDIDESGKNLSLRLLGEYSSLDNLANMPIVLNNQQIISLKDIADIKDGMAEQTQLSRINGQPGVALMIMKQSDSNTVTVARNVDKAVAQLKAELPENIEIHDFFSQADYIQLMINQLRDNLLMGAVLAVIILYFFLRDWRLTLIIGISIPISLMGAFTLLFINDLTLNMMTLGGLALGVGMMVDSSIVILEGITRYREEGMPAKEAAIKGGSELAMAVLSSTLTTVAVFLPIVFTDGMAAIFFKDFALTVAFSLLASLVVALTLVPMLSSKITRIEKPVSRFKPLGFLKRKTGELLKNLNGVYGRILAAALRRRKTTVIIVVAALLLSLAAVPFVGLELLPGFDQGSVAISISMENGTTLEETDKAIQEVERIVAELGHEISSTFVTVGGSTTAVMAGSASDTGSVEIMLNPDITLRRGVAEIGEELRQKLVGIAGAEINVSTGEMSLSGGSALSYAIKGEEFEILQEISDELVAIIEGVEGTREVASSMEDGRPEVQIRINRNKAMQYGLTAAQVASSVRTSMVGETASAYRDSGEEVDIKVRLPDNYSGSVKQAEQIRIRSNLGGYIPLSEIAEFSVEPGPVSISRDNNSRVVTVSAQIAGRDLNSIANDIEAQIPSIILPQGYTIDTGGDVQEMLDAFADLTLALVLAIALIYIIMASLYESLVHPFVVMFSLPTTFIGVVLALALTGRTLNLSSFIGIIMLAGIVVNNGIVLVDSINQLRRDGMELYEAIKKAGSIRLRPVFMTTLTTVLAMLPMAFGIGEGSELTAPMATALIGGLTVSTLFTLIFVPVVYAIVTTWQIKFQEKRSAKRGDVELKSV